MYIRFNDQDFVLEIIPDFDPTFPDIPIEEKYTSEFIASLEHFPDNTEVRQNLKYDRDTHTFYEPPVEPEPESEPTTEDIVKTLLGG